MPRHPSDLRQIPLEMGSVDLVTREVVRTGTSGPHLTPTETALLERLVRNAGHTVPRAVLLREVWGYREGVRTRTVDTTMRRLRRKVERMPGAPRHLLTEEGVGYRFVPLSELPVDRCMQGPLNPTVGRDAELKRLGHLASQGARLISIVGPAGVGKTRLAHEWMRNKGVLEVCLEGVARSADVLGAVAAAAFTRLVSVKELSMRLSMRGVEWLLLDGVEHLLPELGELARGVASTPLRVLVTSRCGLKVVGDTRINLEALDSTAGIKLLRTRAPMALGGAPDAVLEEIVEQLDGLPLALEMAAERASLLGAEGLRNRLSRPRYVLGLGVFGNPKRTLRSDARRSWDRLPAAAARAVTCLAVFRGGFTVDAAEAVIGRPGALDLLQLLRDHAWLRRQAGSGGWRLDLWRPLRDFVREHIGVDPGAELRHARLFSALGPEAMRGAAERDAGEGRRWGRADRLNVERAIEVTRSWEASDVPAVAVLDGHGPLPLLRRTPSSRGARDAKSADVPPVRVRC